MLRVRVYVTPKTGGVCIPLPGEIHLHGSGWPEVKVEDTYPKCQAVRLSTRNQVVEKRASYRIATPDADAAGDICLNTPIVDDR